VEIKARETGCHTTPNPVQGVVGVQIPCHLRAPLPSHCAALGVGLVTEVRRDYTVRQHITPGWLIMHDCAASQPVTPSAPRARVRYSDGCVTGMWSRSHWRRGRIRSSNQSSHRSYRTRVLVSPRLTIRLPDAWPFSSDKCDSEKTFETVTRGR
jgi:hypothetical protein